VDRVARDVREAISLTVTNHRLLGSKGFCGWLRSPIAKFVHDARSYLERYLSTTFDGVTAGVDLTGFSYPVIPKLSVDLDRPTASTVVVYHCEIGLAVLGRLPRAAKVAPATTQTTSGDRRCNREHMFGSHVVRVSFRRGSGRITANSEVTGFWANAYPSFN
jgi:hypothetical protein